jgi:hypothetical protein
LKGILTRCRRGVNQLWPVVSVLLVSWAIAVAQQPKEPEKSVTPAAKESKAPDAKNTAKPTFKLIVSTKPLLNLSLKAEKAKISEVAAELAKKLKTPVFVGQSLQNEPMSVEFSELTLEPALQLMAPNVYVDYEVDIGSSGPPRALGIFLYDADQGEPPLSAAVMSNTQSMLVEGDTEDGVEPATEEARKKLEEQPLRVQFENNRLSLKSKKQPLTVVLLKIGEELGIPVDIQFPSTDVVDVELSKVFVEDAMRRLSPNIKLFLRADLTRSERRALRLVLADPAKASATGFAK